MSEETARAQAEREIGRSDDQSRGADRHADRSGEGKRRNNSPRSPEPKRDMPNRTPTPADKIILLA